MGFWCLLSVKALADAPQVFEGVPTTTLKMKNPRVGKHQQEAALKKNAWQAIHHATRPNMTVVSGPLGSHQRDLAERWAEKHGKGSTVYVDVDELIDKELERETETGIVMHNMLSKGQVIPLSVTMGLVQSLTKFGVDHIVTQNWPTNVDEIKYIRDEFHMQDVFTLIPDGEGEGASEHWKNNFLIAKSENSNRVVDAELLFDERWNQLIPCHNSFCASGDERVHPINVNADSTADDVYAAAEAATKASYIMLTGLAMSGSAECGAHMASQYSQVVRVNPAALQNYAKSTGSDDVNLNEMSGDDMVGLMNGFFGTKQAGSMFVMECLPCNSDQASAMVAAFGNPTAAYYFKSTKEVCTERALAADAALAEPTGLDAEAYGAEQEGQIPILDGIVDCFQSAGSDMFVELNGDGGAADHFATVCSTFSIDGYLVVAPAGRQLSKTIGTALCNKIPNVKLVDAQELVASASTLLTGDVKQKHKPGISRIARLGDKPSAELWEDLLGATVKNNPQSTSFIIINYLNNATVSSYPSVRDLTDVVDKLFNMKKVVYSKFQNADGHALHQQLATLSEPEDLDKTFDAMKYVNAAFGSKVYSCEASEDDVNTAAYAQRVVDGF